MAPTLRKKARISYYEPDEPNLDEYVFCVECADFVYEYCSIHGPLLVIPDDKVPSGAQRVPRAALTVPRAFLHLARSGIPGAGIGVFSTLTLPTGVRFGPYRGARSLEATSSYCWQIYAADRRPAHVVDGADAERANWMRYVNCPRRAAEQNLLAYQYRGHIYYRTIKVVPRFTELLVYYGTEFARRLGVDVRRYSAPRPPPPLEAELKNPALKSRKEYSEYSVKGKVEVTQTDGDTEGYGQTVNGKALEYTDIKANSLNCLNELHQKVEGTSVTINTKFECCAVYDIQRIQYNRNKTTNNPKSPCNKQPNANRTLVQHEPIRKEKPYKCDECDKSYSDSGHLARHKRTHTGEKPYKCDVCDKSFSDCRNLAKHKRAHTGEKPYKCDVCNNSFSHCGSLAQHKRIHTGEKPYKCDVCDKSFSDCRNLAKHKRAHTGEKPYKCDVCNNSFSHCGSLAQHKRIHTGEKPYKCDVCNNSFSQSGSLSQHKRIHTGEKPYKCDVCDKSFSRSGNLVVHIRTHTGEKPYKCDVCDKSFSRSGNLVVHIRTHTGEKPYKCDVCDKSFSDSGNLAQHKRAHTGEKPYKCDVCNNSFSQSGHLAKHKRTHTGEKPYKCDIPM